MPLLPVVLLVEGVDDGADGLAPHAGAFEELLLVHVVLSLVEDLVDVFLRLSLGFPPERNGEVQGGHPLLGAGLLNPPDQLVRPLVRQLGQQDDELVAPDPENQLPGPTDPLQKLGHLHQQLVTHAVSEGIVDQLQPVDIRHDDAQRQVPGHVQPGQLLLEKAPVVEAGQLVVVAEVLDLLLVFDAAGDVAGDADDLVVLAPAQPQLIVADAPPDGQRVLEMLDLTGFQRQADLGQPMPGNFRRHDFSQGTAQKGLLGGEEPFRAAGLAVQKAAVTVQHEQDIRQSLHHRPVPFLADPQLGLALDDLLILLPELLLDGHQLLQGSLHFLMGGRQLLLLLLETAVGRLQLSGPLAHLPTQGPVPQHQQHQAPEGPQQHPAVLFQQPVGLRGLIDPQPFLVDAVVVPGGLGHLQAAVEHLKQLVVAPPHGHAVIVGMEYQLLGFDPLQPQVPDGVEPRQPQDPGVVELPRFHQP